MKRPVTAAAAAIAGPTRWVRLPGPWRPWKLRLLVEADARLNEEFESISLRAHARTVTRSVQGRDIIIPKVAEGVAMAGFEELCAQPLGPGDYLEIARCFHTLIVKGIPKLGPENRNEAKRFVTLIDALSDARVNLICSAAAPADALYT